MNKNNLMKVKFIMDILEVGMIGIGLAMDAFAVAICKGLSMKKFNLKKMIIIALYFGFFQFLMPIIRIFFRKYICRHC